MSFFRWWIRQLIGLMPLHLLQAAIESGEATILEISDDGFALHIRRKASVVQAAAGRLADLKSALAAASDLPPLRLLRVPPEQALHKALSLPSAARRNLKAVLGYEIDRETPFEQAEVYWDYRLSNQAHANGNLDVGLVVVPRRAVDGLAAIAEEAGFSPVALEVANSGQRASLLWLETPNPFQLFRLPPWARLSLAGICGVAAILVLAPFAVKQARFFLADRTIDAIENDARAAATLNLAANRRMAALVFMGQMHRGASALEILATTTRVLPDDSYLSSLSVHDGQITITGSSEAAAKLIGALAVSPSFHNPVFDSAVLEGDDDNLEKFTISAQLAAAGAP